MSDEATRRALAAFDIAVFAARVGGTKESRSLLSAEWLFPCFECGSSRLRYNHVKGGWVCWKCNRTGDTLALVAGMLRIDEFEAMTYILSTYVGGDAPSGALVAPLRRERPLVRMLAPIAWPDGVEVLTEPCAPHARAWAYLAKRGLAPEVVRAYRLGYGRTGRCRERIVFPIYMDGALVSWQARATWDPDPNAPRGAFVKTINPLAEREEDTRAGEVLFGFDLASVYPHLVVCEGPIDAIKVGPHACALLGKIPTPSKVARLRRARARAVTIYLDRGVEERARAEQLAGSLAGLFEVRIATPPEGHDPGSLDPAANAAILAAAEPFRPRI